MKVLILGHSSLVRRRVAPALESLGATMEIASRSKPEGRTFDSYDAALRDSDAPLVYVSTVNSTHEELVEAALASGRHVVVDKPAALSLDAVRRLASLAAGASRLIAEATVWSFHPQIVAARTLFDEAGSAPQRLVATFSIPPMPPGDFRNDPALGGGALWDLGPYAVSPGRVFFGAPPADVIGRSDDNGNVDVAFIALMRYPGGRSLTGHFGMTTAYVNRLEILGAEMAVALEPAFTTAADAVCRLQVNERNQRRVVEVAPANSFAHFFAAVFEAIEKNEHAPFAEAMLADAEVLARLRQSCGVSR